MRLFRLALLPLFSGAALAGAAEAQRPDPPATEAAAVRMLASADYRERDEAMFYVLAKGRAGEPIGAELRAAMLRAAEDPGWADGRPGTGSEEKYSDGWGETWSFYGDAVSRMRHPDAIPFMLTRYGSPYDLAAIGRPAILPMIEALEDPEADAMHTVDVALRGLTLAVHDGLPTGEELERIVDATRYRLDTGLLLSAAEAFGLAVTLDSPELLAIVERAASNREAAGAMETWRPAGVAAVTQRALVGIRERVQERAREALQPGFVPYVIRYRRE